MPALDILQIDDPVGAIPVHFVGSIWGMIAVGLFLEEDSLLSLSKGEAGIFQKADLHLLGVQSLSLIVVGAWSVLTTYTLLQIINILIPLRIKKEDEEAGADEVEHNIKHYTSLEIRQFSSTTSLNIRS
ncbi:ammonium transporter [Trichonephila clavipes]|nr:ammonium transporter [Trichonephila clavipes]